MITERGQRGRRQLGAYLLIVVAVVVGFAGLGHEVATIRDQGREIRETIRSVAVVEARVTRASCERTNRLQDGLVGFIDGTTARARRSAAAVVGSHTASSAEKAAAQTNLAQILELHKRARAKFPDKDCG